MSHRIDPILLRDERPSLRSGIAAAVIAIGVATGAIFALRQIAPAVSLSVVYLIAVLLVSIYWGLALGVATSIASALAFNFFFLPPVGRFTIADTRNFVALLALLLVAIVVSSIAQAARSRAVEAEERRRESDLNADMARILLGGAQLEASLALTAHRLAEVLGAASVSIELGEVAADPRRMQIELTGAAGRIGTLVLPSDLAARQELRVRERVVPSLESILGAALARERLQQDVVETQSLRRSDEMKTALLRSVSHDLRTPVTSILAGARALRSASVTGPEREELELDIADGATRLSLLIDKLLDLARLQAGTAAPNSQWCSIEETLREAADQVPAPAAGFVFSIDSGLPLVRADAAQLERAFANLLENAALYGGTHPISVRVRSTGQRLLVRIVDRGPGIAHHEHERIFSPFYRAAASADRPGGSGLGLSIAKGFIEANGGEIRVESFPGQGATFVIELPIGGVDDPTALPGGTASAA